MVVKFEEGALKSGFYLLLGLMLLAVGFYHGETFLHVMNNPHVSNEFFLSRGIIAGIATVFGVLFLYGGLKKK
jgi:formate-dependent nitrite reductase membrane component NrfD